MKKFIGTFYRIISLAPFPTQATRSPGEQARDAEAASQAQDSRPHESAEDASKTAGPPEEDFFVDLEMEEEAILREAALLPSLPDFNYLRIDQQTLRQFGYVFGLEATPPDLRHLFSCRSGQQLLVVNMEKVWLANAETAVLVQEMRRKDVAQVNILPNSVTVVGSPRGPHKLSEMVVLDRNRFAAVADYFSLYWVNLVISPLAKQL